jgi:predicted S18 family serine protease
MSALLATVTETIQQSRQSAMNGDYATANVFYTSACEQVSTLIKASKCNADWQRLKENLQAEQASIAHLMARTTAFTEAAVNVKVEQKSETKKIFFVFFFDFFNGFF